MRLPNLDMDALRTLLLTQQTGSLIRAAERVGRSQSAVSQQLRKLEEQVGESLFRRQGRGLVLTESGNLVLSYARRILDLNDEVVRSVRGASIAGVVRFGLPGDFAETWLPAALGQFKRTHPGVRVEIAVERNGALLERLDRSELDLVLVMGYANRPDAEHLATLPMRWIGPAAIDFELRHRVPLDLALYNPPCFFRRAGIEALDNANIAWRLAYTTSSLQSLWAGVAAGLGITLRTAAGLPTSLRPLDGRSGLPLLPTVELCLHAGRGEVSAALAALRDVVVENVMANLKT
jgi:DNA-binding transcriptional LysR family regulator